MNTFLAALLGSICGMLIFNIVGYFFLVYRSRRIKRKAESLLEQLKNTPGVKVVSSQEELAEMMMGGSSSNGDPTSWN